MYKMDVVAPESIDVDIRPELREAIVQKGFGFAPVEVVSPALNQPPSLGGWSTSRPWRFYVRLELGREFRQSELVMEALEPRVGNGDLEWSDWGSGHDAQSVSTGLRP